MKARSTLFALTLINVVVLALTTLQHWRPAFAGRTGTKDTYVILQSQGNVSSLKLRNESGRELLVEP